MRRAVALLLVLLGAAFWLWRGREAAPTPASPAAPAPVQEAAAARRGPDTATAALPVPTPATPGLPEPAPAAVTPVPVPPDATAVLVPPAIREVVTANSVPGRMLFFDFALDRAGLRLVSAQGAAGRAKPPAGPRAGFGFIHFEVFAADGSLRLAGSVEDPTRRRIEHPAATDDGRIATTVQFADEGAFAVRLPGEIAPARLILFRDRNPAAPAPAGREMLGDFRLLSFP